MCHLLEIHNTKDPSRIKFRLKPLAFNSSIILRSLYFLLAEAAARFRYLKVGLALILVFVGAKLLVAGFLEIPPLVSLAVIVSILGLTVGASLRRAGDAESTSSGASSRTGD